MIQHNLTLAWRQLVKYRLQSAVSIVSLAIGFACMKPWLEQYAVQTEIS